MKKPFRFVAQVVLLTYLLIVLFLAIDGVPILLIDRLGLIFVGIVLTISDFADRGII